MRRALFVFATLFAAHGCVDTIHIDVSAATNPELVDLGDSAVGLRSQALITVRNGSEQASEVEFEADGELTTPQYQFWFPDRRRVIEAGALERFRVFFLARAVMDTPASATIRLRMDMGFESTTFRARGVPAIQLDTDRVSFGSVARGSSAERTLVIANLLDVPLSIKRVNASPLQGRERFELSTWSDQLLPGESTMTVRVRYTPNPRSTSNEPDRTEWMFTYCDDPVLCSVNVELVGRAAEAMRSCIEVDQQQIDFGKLELGRSREGWIAVRNRCDHAINISELRAGAAATGAFRTSERSLSIGARGCSKASVFFQPNREGFIDTELVIVSDDPSRAEVRVPLRGAGVQYGSGSIFGGACHLSYQAPSLRFGEVEIMHARPAAIVLENIGSKACVLGELDLLGDDADNFEITAATPAIAAGESGIVEVSYRPSDVGPDDAQVSLAYQPSSLALVRELFGTGVGGAPVFAPERIDFGAVPGGCTPAVSSLSIINPRDEPLVLEGIAVGSRSSPDFRISSPPDLPLTIAPRQAYDLSIAYAPQLRNADSGVIVIREAGHDEPYKVWLLGREGEPGE